MPWEEHNISSIKFYNLNSVMKNHQTDPNWKHFQYNWPMSFKSIKVIEVKQRPRNSSKLEESSDMTTNEICDFELDLFIIKGIIGKMRETNGVWKIRWYYVSMFIFWSCSCERTGHVCGKCTVNYLGVGAIRSAAYSQSVLEENSSFYCTCKFAISLQIFKIRRNKYSVR